MEEYTWFSSNKSLQGQLRKSKQIKTAMKKIERNNDSVKLFIIIKYQKCVVIVKMTSFWQLILLHVKN
jgi:hypothetical protein